MRTFRRDTQRAFVFRSQLIGPLSICSHPPYMELYLEKAPFLNSDKTILSLRSIILTTRCFGEDLLQLLRELENKNEVGNLGKRVRIPGETF